MIAPTANRSLPERAPEAGELVQVRSRGWLVEEVVQSTAPGHSSLVRLACADDDAQGQSLDVFWDYELDRQILQEEGWRDLAAKGFDAPRQFAAFLHTLRWNCVTATDPNLFQAPFRAGIKIDPYQMEPLRKALRLPRVNLFIADDTGLGKTIEAGLIARELLLRKKAKTIVVAAPPSVLEQWKAELEERFGLVFEILDRAYLTKMRRERGFGVNPWRTHSRFLVSHNLLIDPTYADPMREWLGPLLPGSLLILDEAHHAAPASGGRYGIEGGEDVAAALLELEQLGISGSAIAAWIRTVEEATARTPRPDLVWSGPEVPGLHARDTRRVYEELLGSAERSVWASTYAFLDGPRAFEVLARRMDARSELRVTLLLNIQRKRGDTTAAEQLVRRFADRFWGTDWPGSSRPRVYYDPRALESEGPAGILHAKALVVDDEAVFVTSANLTEAALDRNIEVGLLVRDRALAASVSSHFRGLIDRGLLHPLPMV